MAEPRRLARDPLADLLATDADLARPSPLDPPPRSSTGSPRGGARLTVQVGRELAEEVRDAVMWLHKVDVHTTISAIAEAGLRTELERLREAHSAGERFPRRTGKVPTGRPPKP